MRAFELHRDVDPSGISGTGTVAEGVEFSDGVVALRWLVPAGAPGAGNPTSVVFHDRGMESVQIIHGHSGATRIVWQAEQLDPDLARALRHVVAADDNEVNVAHGVSSIAAGAIEVLRRYVAEPLDAAEWYRWEWEQKAQQPVQVLPGAAPAGGVTSAAEMERIAEAGP